jgi:hypothetical protein
MAVGDFEQQTGVEALAGDRFRATLHREWQTCRALRAGRIAR